MALLRSLKNKETGLLIKPLNYTEKAEQWFSTELSFIKENKKIKFVKGSLHHNDFVNLIVNIQNLLENKTNDYKFEPIEPYLRMNISHGEDGYSIDILLNAGPVFNDQNYERYRIYISVNHLSIFIEELIDELKKINPWFNLESVK